MSPARTRPAALAGTWYPGEADVLAGQVDGFLAEAKPEPEAGRLRGIISPHAGYRYSGACAGYGYALARGGPWERVVILAPSHHEHFRGACISDYEAYDTPLGAVAVDVAAGEELSRSRFVRRLPEAEREEHAVEIQLPFLQRALGEFRLVPVLFGQVSEADLAGLVEALAPLVEDRTLLVASSDLTHYGDSFGYRPFDREVKQNLEKLDRGALELIERRDERGLVDYHHRTGITACGIRPILALLSLLPEASRGKLLCYYTSGDLTGDWQHTVSYASVAFHEETAPGRDLDAAEGHELLALARRTLERRARGEDVYAAAEGERPPAGSPLAAQRGVFVTLRQGRSLRGCIGAVEARQPLYLSVVEEAVNAAENDPRFEPLRPEELARTRIEITVLGPLSRIPDDRAFQPGRHGILLEKGEFRAVFLPQVATEQGWSREETLDHLAEKAGLRREAWREGAILQVFTGQVFQEEGTGSGSGG